MSDLTVARRYAQALFELAREQDQLDAVVADLRQVLETVEGHGGLQAMLRHRRIPPAAKQEVLGQVFAGSVGALTLNFLRVLVEHRREESLAETCRQVIHLADAARGVQEAVVRTAAQLPEAELQALRERLRQVTGKQIVLRQQIDPSLLGGVVVKIGDRVYDGSIRRRLATMRQILRQTELREIGVKEA